jgi:hypothetical protein
VVKVVQPMANVSKHAIDVEDREASHAPTLAHIDVASLAPWDLTTQS